MCGCSSVVPLKGGAEYWLTYQPLVWGKCMKSLAADALKGLPYCRKMIWQKWRFITWPQSMGVWRLIWPSDWHCRQHHQLDVQSKSTFDCQLQSRVGAGSGLQISLNDPGLVLSGLGLSRLGFRPDQGSWEVCRGQGSQAIFQLRCGEVWRLLVAYCLCLALILAMVWSLWVFRVGASALMAGL